MRYITLRNGVKMPQLGYGVYQVSQEACEQCVLDAVAAGYRSIDTAQAYGNEEAVGSAIAKCGVPREELFITTKVWISNAGERKAGESIGQSLAKLRTDYVDLLLVHQPFGDYYGTYRAMEEAYRAGKARAIGVSNFYPDRLADICLNTEIPPMVNQVETHVYQQQTSARLHGPIRRRARIMGPVRGGKKGFLPGSRPDRDRREIRQVGGSGSAALSDSEGRHRHPQDDACRSDAGEFRRLRLFAHRGRHVRDCRAGSERERVFLSLRSPDRRTSPLLREVTQSGLSAGFA